MDFDLDIKRSNNEQLYSFPEHLIEEVLRQ